MINMIYENDHRKAYRYSIFKQQFPSPWKIVRTCAIPKVQKISSNKDLRPISILPSLSKIFERLVLRQMSDFVTNTTTGVLNQSISAYRKGHMHYDSYVGNARWYSASYEKR